MAHTVQCTTAVQCASSMSEQWVPSTAHEESKIAERRIALQCNAFISALCSIFSIPEYLQYRVKGENTFANRAENFSSYFCTRLKVNYPDMFVKIRKRTSTRKGIKECNIYWDVWCGYISCFCPASIVVNSIYSGRSMGKVAILKDNLKLCMRRAHIWECRT